MKADGVLRSGRDMTRSSDETSPWRRWEPLAFIVGALVLGLLILGLYLISPGSFPDDFLPGFS